MDQATRVLTLLRELPLGSGTASSPAPALAELLGTSERTLYRDIAALSEAGFAIGNEGHGCFLIPTDGRAPHHFTAQEVVSLLYVAQWAEQVLPEGMQGDYLAAVGRLVASLGSQDARHAALDGTAGLSIQRSATDRPRAERHMVTALLARQKGRKVCGPDGKWLGYCCSCCACWRAPRRARRRCPLCIHPPQLSGCSLGVDPNCRVPAASAAEATDQGSGRRGYRSRARARRCRSWVGLGAIAAVS